MEPVFKELLTIEEFETTIPLLLVLNGGDPVLDKAVMAQEFLRAIEHDYHHFGIYLNNRLVGTFSLSLRYNPTFYKPGCEVNGLIINEAERSKGIGKKAMDFAAEWAKQKGAGFMRLFVHPGNERAMFFYKELGYRHTSDYMFKNLMD